MLGPEKEASGGVGMQFCGGRRSFCAFAANPANAHNRVLAIWPRFSFKTQGILEIESDNRAARYLKEKKSKCTDGNRMRGMLLLLFAHFRMPLLGFAQSRLFQLVHQVVRFYTKSLAAAHVHKGALGIFWRKFITQFRGAARGQHDEGVGQMDGIPGSFCVAEPAQTLVDNILRISLPRINHVVDRRGGFAKVRGARFRSSSGRSPNGLTSRHTRPFAIIEILTQQAKFPKLVSNVFSYVRYRSIRPHDNLVLLVLVFFRGLFLSLLNFLFFPRQDPTSLHLAAFRKVNRVGFLQHLERGIPKLQMQDFALARQ